MSQITLSDLDHINLVALAYDGLLNSWHKDEQVRKIALVLLVCIGFVAGVSAHSGGTNSAGCHTNHKTGGYHCH